MHVTTVLSPKYEAMVGERGGKDCGVNEAGMKEMDDNIGDVLKKVDDMGQTTNTIAVFTTNNGAEAITFPDGGVTPFKGHKGEAWEGGYRAPMVIRWPGHIKPGTVRLQGSYSERAAPKEAAPPSPTRDKRNSVSHIASCGCSCRFRYGGAR